MRTRATIFLGLYLCAVLYLTLFPWNFQFYPKGNGLYWVPLVTRRTILDGILNVLLFGPVGAAGFFAFGRRWWSVGITIIVGGLVSWGIESLQLWTPNRYANLNDVAANTLGTTIGCMAAWAIEKLGWWQRPQVHRQTARWRLSPVEALFAGLWLVWQAFPFIPLTDLARINQFTAPAVWSWQTFGTLLVGAAMLRIVLGRSHWIWVAGALIPAQAFLLGRSFSYAALLGVISGWLVAAAAGELLRSALPWALAMWLVYEEFRPFALAAQPQPFVWEPFRTWYDVPAISYYAVVFGKLFFDTATVWSLRSRLGWAGAVGIPAVILVVGEWAQQYLEGRTPDSTDVVMLAAGAVLLGLCSKR